MLEGRSIRIREVRRGDEDRPPSNVMATAMARTPAASHAAWRTCNVRPSVRRARTHCAASSEAVERPPSYEAQVLQALEVVIDPDLGASVVECGFVKDLRVNPEEGSVSFALELTTPACPVKEQFETEAKEAVMRLPWAKTVDVTMTAQPSSPGLGAGTPASLSKVSNIIAVSSCKGGVGKSTVAVNLAYSLQLMGAKVGILDADVYGPSLPTMVSPEKNLLEMEQETNLIKPVEFMGVKHCSFGFTGQGAAVMRGPMVSGLISQLLLSTDWGELDYLLIDFPPGTGDIQLTLCQSAPITGAVIVTTPQNLAFIDVAKGIKMFAKLAVPCMAVVENMSWFEGDGKRYFPFGKGSGDRIVEDFSIPHIFRMPIVPELSLSSDSGLPLVLSQPSGDVARAFGDIGAAVVRESAKLKRAVKNAVRYDSELNALVVKIPGKNEEFLLHPPDVRRNDRSASSVDEWTGKQLVKPSDIPESIRPESVQPLGNYAVQITWDDGFNQVAPFTQLEEMERLIPPRGYKFEPKEELDASSARKILESAEAIKQN